MPVKRFTADKIINMQKEAEVLISTGKTKVEVCRKLNISKQTYYRWRKENGSIAELLRESGEMEGKNIDCFN